MSTQTIRNGASIAINLQAGETLKAVAVSGTYTLTGTAGSVRGTTIATAATGGTYGPYAAAVTVLLASSVSSEIDFDSGTVPVIDTDTVARVSTDSTGKVNGIVGGDGAQVNTWLKRKIVAGQQSNPITSPVLATPTVAEAAWAADLATAYTIRASAGTGLFRLTGGVLAGSVPANAEIKASSIQTASNVGVTGVYQTAPGIEFVTTANNVRLKIYVGGGAYAAKFRVRVDGAFVKTRTLAAFGAVGVFRQISIDLSTYDAGFGKKVKIEWDGPAVASILSIDSGAIWEPFEGDRIRGIAYGDSFSAFGANRSPHTAALAQAMDIMGIEYTMSGVGGTGYTVDGGGNYKFSDAARLADLTAQPFDVAFVSGVTNDVASSASSVTAAVASVLGQVRAALPGKPIFVIGAYNSTAGSSVLTQTQAETAALAGFNQVKDNLMWFVPCSTDSDGVWVTAGNSASMISDGTHFTAAGETYGAMRIVRNIGKQLGIF